MGNPHQASAMLEATPAKTLCPTCLPNNKPKIAGRKLPCTHAFCTSCLATLHACCVTRGIATLCPTCQEPILSGSLEENKRLCRTLKKTATYRRQKRRKSIQECSLCSTPEEPSIANTILLCSHRFCVICLVTNHAFHKIKNLPSQCPTCRTLIDDQFQQQLERHCLYQKALKDAEKGRIEDLQEIAENDDSVAIDHALEGIHDVLTNNIGRIYDEVTLTWVKDLLHITTTANTFDDDELTQEEKNKLIQEECEKQRLYTKIREKLTKEELEKLHSLCNNYQPRRIEEDDGQDDVEEII